MINTALVIGAKHISHSIRILVFAHDGKGIPQRAGISLLALMVLWCLLRMAYTALRANSEDTLPDIAVALAFAALTPALLRLCLRPSAFFVFGHASLLIELILVLDIVSSMLTGQPIWFQGWLLAMLVVWTLAATFFTMLRFVRLK